MAFPVPATITTTDFPDAPTSHAVDMPADVDAGDVLLMFFHHKSSFFDESATPSGWTLHKETTGSGTEHRLYTFAKVAAGTEGGTTVSVVTSNGFNSNGTDASAQVWRLTGVQNGLSGIESAEVTESANETWDPPSLSPSWGTSDDSLFIVVVGGDKVGSGQVDEWPGNYNDNQTQVGDGATSIATGAASRNLNAASENPGTGSLNSITRQVVQTLAIQGVGVASPSLAYPPFPFRTLRVWPARR